LTAVIILLFLFIDLCLIYSEDYSLKAERIPLLFDLFDSPYQLELILRITAWKLNELPLLFGLFDSPYQSEFIWRNTAWKLRKSPLLFHFWQAYNDLIYFKSCILKADSHAYCCLYFSDGLHLLFLLLSDFWFILFIYFIVYFRLSVLFIVESRHLKNLVQKAMLCIYWSIHLFYFV
jgi:hypothetical protein